MVETMDGRSVFDLDCSGVIPECGFKCPKCIAEVQSTLGAMEGVSKVYVEKHGEVQVIVVEHNPAVATAGQLVDVLKGLPSFYKGFFIPNLLPDTKKHN